MKTFKSLMIASFALFGFNATLHAQGFVDGFFSEQGALSVTASYTRGSFDEFYVGSNKVDLTATGDYEEITQDIYDIYAKYEIAPDLVAFLNVPIIVANGDLTQQGRTNNVKDDDSGVQDISVGLKYRIHEFEFETSDLSIISAATLGLPGDYEPNGILSLGTGAVSAEFTAGVHFGTEQGFFTTALGSYTFKDDSQRNGDFNVPDAFSTSLKVGYANSILYVDAWVDHVNSVRGIDISDTDFGGRFPATEVEYTRIGGTVYGKATDNFGVSLGFGTILDGRNVGKATTVSIGLTYDVQLL